MTSSIRQEEVGKMSKRKEEGGGREFLRIVHPLTQDDVHTIYDRLIGMYEEFFETVSQQEEIRYTGKMSAGQFVDNHIKAANLKGRAEGIEAVLTLLVGADAFTVDGVRGARAINEGLRRAQSKRELGRR